MKLTQRHRLTSMGCCVVCDGDAGTRQVANALAQTERLSVLKMYGLPAESKETQNLVRGKTEAKKVILCV